MNQNQKELVQNLHRLLLDINEEALNDDEFYEWLNENYFFSTDLETVIMKVKKAKGNLE